ncbi:hypothetical protein PSTG_08911 [Puccinia striiformis f. sp. tritici PST-78]|uniref:Uncharacterized protein n=1 Tax=Puccinia striiformis f. sp. tritici PST-78 TaxID=1165861 RepID=A0A0L0VFW5_9BASI|nr:hypothetical protein PSTG_08911 [Puccinia striiformis f. sp. tritici PST-78]
MSNQSTPANTGYSTPTAPQLTVINGGPPSSGVTIPPEVWAQMQAMFTMFAAPPLAGPITVPPAPPGLAPSSTHLTTVNQCVPAGLTASLAQSADSRAKLAQSLGQLAGFDHLIPPLDKLTPYSPAPSIAGVQAPSSLGSSVSSCGGNLEPNKLPDHNRDHNDEDIHAEEMEIVDQVEPENENLSILPLLPSLIQEATCSSSLKSGPSTTHTRYAQPTHMLARTFTFSVIGQETSVDQWLTIRDDKRPPQRFAAPSDSKVLSRLARRLTSSFGP